MLSPNELTTVMRIIKTAFFDVFLFHNVESYERRLTQFTECIAAIESFMTANRLNTETTDLIWLGSKHQLTEIQSHHIVLEAVRVPVSLVVTCLRGGPV